MVQMADHQQRLFCYLLPGWHLRQRTLSAEPLSRKFLQGTACTLC
jgi:hypothetical protein